MLNKAMLIGHLGRDPEVRYTASGKAVANFTLATSDKAGGEERTEWHRIVCWDRLAETVGRYLTKGRQVFVEGRIQSRSWEDRDGNKRSTTEIVAYSVQFLGSASEQADAQQQPERQERRPYQRAQARPLTQRDEGRGSRVAEDDDGVSYADDDDIPF